MLILPSLLPKNKPGEEDENRMQMVNHNGRAYYIPASETEKVQINSLFRWEQAFRVFLETHGSTPFEKLGYYTATSMDTTF